MSNQQATVSLALRIVGEERLMSLIDKMQKAQSIGRGPAQTWTPESVKAYGATVDGNGTVRGDRNKNLGQMGGTIPGSQDSNGFGSFMQNPLVQFGKNAAQSLGYMNLAGGAACAVWGSYESIQQRAEMERFAKAVGSSADAADKLHSQLLDTAKQFGVTSTYVSQFAVQAMGGGLSIPEVNSSARWAAGLNASGVRSSANAGAQQAQRGVYGTGADEAMVDAAVAIVEQNPLLRGRGDEIYQSIAGLTQAVMQQGGASTTSSYDDTFKQFAAMQNILGATMVPGLTGQNGANVLSQFGQTGTSGLGLAMTMAGYAKNGGTLDLATLYDMKNNPMNPAYLEDRIQAMFPNGTQGMSDEQIQNIMAIYTHGAVPKNISAQFAKSMYGMSQGGMDQFNTMMNGMDLSSINPGALNYAAAASTVAAGGTSAMGDMNDIITQYLQSVGVSGDDAKKFISSHGGANAGTMQAALQAHASNSGLGVNTGQQQAADLTNITTSFVQAGDKLSAAVDGVATVVQKQIDVMNAALDNFSAGQLKTAGQVGAGASSIYDIGTGAGKVAGGLAGFTGAKWIWNKMRPSGGATDAAASGADAATTGAGADAAATGGATAGASAATAATADAAIPVIAGVGIGGVAGLASLAVGGALAGYYGGQWWDDHHNGLKPYTPGPNSPATTPHYGLGPAGKPGPSLPSYTLPGSHPQTTDPTGSNKQLAYHYKGAADATPQGSMGSLATGNSTVNTQNLKADSLDISDSSGLASALTRTPLTMKMDNASQHGLATEIAKAMQQKCLGVGGGTFGNTSALTGGGITFPAVGMASGSPAALKGFKSTFDGTAGSVPPEVIALSKALGLPPQLMLAVMAQEGHYNNPLEIQNDAGGGQDYGPFNVNTLTHSGDLAGMSQQQKSDPLTAFNIMGSQYLNTFNAMGGMDAYNADPNGFFAKFMPQAQGSVPVPGGSVGPDMQQAAQWMQQGGFDQNGNPVGGQSAGTQTSPDAQTRSAGMNVNVTVTGKVDVTNDGQTYSALLSQGDTSVAYADAGLLPTQGTF